MNFFKKLTIISLFLHLESNIVQANYNRLLEHWAYETEASQSGTEYEAMQAFRNMLNGDYPYTHLQIRTTRDIAPLEAALTEYSLDAINNQLLTSVNIITMLDTMSLEFARSQAIVTIIKNVQHNIRTSQRNHLHKSQELLLDRFSDNFMSQTQQQADKLIELSYFSPDMQHAVLACVDKEFEVNIVTGKVSNIPSIEDIISSSPTDNKIKIKGLHAALEAVRIARFYGKLNIAYDNPAYIFFAPTLSSNKFLMPSLDEELEKSLAKYETNIVSALKEIPEYKSLWSWIPTDLINMVSIMPHGLAQQNPYTSKLEFNADIYNINKRAGRDNMPDNFVKIAGSTLQGLIKNFDYKQKVNAQQAATLLWKQCFIAQQTFPTEDWALYCTPLGSTISASRYIFDRFEVARKKISTQNNTTFSQLNQQSLDVVYASNLDELCNVISQRANIAPHNPLQAHLLFLRIRKAIQTAMYIANKNSNFYIGYILPPAITQYLDGIVQQLIVYDQKLSALCKNQQLGATKDDLLRDTMWNNISMFATGLGFVAAVGSLIDYGYGTGTSGKVVGKTVEKSIENATYYGGKAIINTAYYGTTVPLQAAGGIISGTVTGVGNVTSGIAKGAGNLAADAYHGIGNALGGQRKQPEQPIVTPKEIQSQNVEISPQVAYTQPQATHTPSTSSQGIIEHAQGLLASD